MKITAFIIITIFSFLNETNAQNPELLWKVQYPQIDSIDFNFKNSATDKNGNIYITGYNVSLIDSSTEYETIKFNSLGQKLWNAEYQGILKTRTVIPYAICADNSGNVCVTGTEGYGTFLTVVKYDSLGNQLWAKRYTSDSVSTNIGNDIVTDKSGNIYVTGESVGKLTDYDFITIKFDGDGQIDWVNTYDDTLYQETAHAIALDSSGNVLVTGNNTGGATSKFSFITIKYNSSGARMWVKETNVAPGFNESNSITTDADGNVYVTGSSGFNEGSNCITMKYNSSGGLLWVGQYNGLANKLDKGIKVQVDNSGNVYVGGYSFNESQKQSFLTLKYNSIGNLLWAKHYFNSAYGYCEATSIALDNSGNVYTAGILRSNLSLNDLGIVKYDAAGNQIWDKVYVSNSDGYYNKSFVNIFSNKIILTGPDIEKTGRGYIIVNYDDSGNINWKSRHGYNTVNRINDFLVDNFGNTFVTGSAMNNNSGLDFITAKFDSTGNLLWAKRYNGPANTTDEGFSICKDNEMNIIVTGASKGISTQEDFATIKYDSSGNQLWVSRYNGPQFMSDIPLKVKTDIDGNVYVGGNSIGLNNSYDFAALKYNKFGQLQWAKRYDDQLHGNDKISSFSLDKDANVYVSGSSDSSSSLTDYLIIKYNKSGDEEWVRRYNGTGNDGDQLNATVLDDSANIYITGWSIGDGTDKDFATIKYNTNGVLQWSARWDDPANSSDAANSIIVDRGYNVYVTGSGPGAGTGSDFITIKYNSSGVEQWVSLYDDPSSRDDSAMYIALDDYDNPYLIGKSGKNLAIVKYDNNGLKQWDLIQSDDNNLQVSPTGIFVNNNGNIITGQTSSAENYGYWNIQKYNQPNYKPLSVERNKEIPSNFILYQNYPNPFNPSTIISWQQPVDGRVSIKVYDILGREVATLVDERKSAGNYKVVFKANTLSSGIYFYRIHAGLFNQINKMILMK